MAINGMRSLGQPGGKGETILIQGTGGVSIMGLMIGKASGAESKTQIDRHRNTHVVSAKLSNSYSYIQL